MIYLIGVLTLVSLTLNGLMYRRITATYPLGDVKELEPTTSHDCCDSIIRYLEGFAVAEEAHDPPPAPTPVPSDTYSAWKNQTNIPWVPPTKLPEPIVKAPDRGPLARPDGFI